MAKLSVWSTSRFLPWPAYQIRLWLLAIAALPGCGGKDTSAENAPELSHEHLDPVPLATEPIASNPVFGRLYGMAAARDGWLWLADAKGDPFLYLLTPSQYDLDRAIGRAGEGPGDFKSATDLSFRSGDSTAIWIYDTANKRFTRVPRDRMAEPQVIGPLPHQVLHATWLGADRIVGITRSDSSRFMLLDDQGRVISGVRGTLLGGDTIPLSARSQLSAGVKLCARPTGGRFAVIYLGAGRVELVDSLGSLRTLADVPFSSNGEFIRDEESGEWAARLPRNFYVSCAATPERLFVLFSGRKRDMFESEVASSGRFIHVFDWDGRLHDILRLDRDATSLAVVGDRRIIVSSLGSDTVFSVVSSTPP